MVQTQTYFVQVPLHLHRRLHVLFLRRLPPNESYETWLLVFFDGFLTASFILFSVTEVDWIRERPIAEKLSAQCVIECTISVQNKRAHRLQVVIHSRNSSKPTSPWERTRTGSFHWH